MEQNLQRIALEIIHLKKEYSDDKENKVIAVDDISFSVKPGEIFSFLGPNGAGKSTTISIAATQLQPTSGNIRIFGSDILTQTAEVRKHIGICPQDLVFYENLTIMENLMFFGKMNDCPTAEIQKYAEKLIAQVGLEEKKNALAIKLSGGMKRRLNIIIALIHDPDFIFLDEPTAGLDPQTRRLVWDFLVQLKARGKTIFLTTHYMDEADVLSDRIAIIDHGKIVALDSPFDLKRKYSQGDLIEFKFKEPDEQVIQSLMNGDSSESTNNHLFHNMEYIKDDHLFRLAVKEGLIVIPALLTQIQQVNLHISDMNVKANSLENVFLNLTGRQLRN